MKKILVGALAGAVMALSAGFAMAYPQQALEGKIVSVNPQKTMLTMEDGQKFLIPSNVAGEVPNEAGFWKEATVLYRTQADGQKVLTALFIDSDTASGN